ncbi:MAG: DNA (cytosine-5-)-methyltransferase [Gammaproteobacteria bacterium]|nr:DNA (cytosine-5-)-methyltransferase [Gammaproteobacteria bacterium]
MAGLYAGIGGFELGFERSGHRAVLMSEIESDAMCVIRHRFADVTLDADVVQLSALPEETEVVTAGFPCQNLSMAGDKSGVGGDKTQVVNALFRLLEDRPVPWVVIENVYFMLHLAKGEAMDYILSHLEGLGYSWASRVVDSRAFGLPQRRRRVYIVASQAGDPRDVLLADDVPGRTWPALDMARPIGFYWTEGRTGHGLTADAVPPLKAGSGLGIPSPPAVFLPSGRVVTPPIEAIERLQGFPARWTTALRKEKGGRNRWRLVGNAVSVPVAEWIGRRLCEPGAYDGTKDRPFAEGAPWPRAAWCMGNGRMVSTVSEYPLGTRRGRLSAFKTRCWPDLSTRALAGFVRRAHEGNLRYPPGFLDALDANL